MDTALGHMGASTTVVTVERPDLIFYPIPDGGSEGEEIGVARRALGIQRWVQINVAEVAGRPGHAV